MVFFLRISFLKNGSIFILQVRLYCVKKLNENIETLDFTKKDNDFFIAMCECLNCAASPVEKDYLVQTICDLSLIEKLLEVNNIVF